MAESIVKVPSTAGGGSFLAFSFKGKHSYDDFGIYRVSDGNRYNDNLVPTLNDKTAETPNGDGLYYFNTHYRQKDFQISFAFDYITEEKLREMRQWLNGKEMGDLWFEEAPYKIYSVKVTGQPSIKYIPFDEYYMDDTTQKIRRVYKGEGSITFTAYYPYAHTPDGILKPISIKNGTAWDKHLIFPSGEDLRIYSSNASGTILGKQIMNWSISFSFEWDDFYGESDPSTGILSGYNYFGRTDEYLGFGVEINEDVNCEYFVFVDENETMGPYCSGKYSSSYEDFKSAPEFLPASGLTDTPSVGSNPGDISAPFVLSVVGQVAANSTFKVGDAQITTKTVTYNLKWDSKTGVVSSTKSYSPLGERSLVSYTGNPFGSIPVGGLPSDKIQIGNDATLEYYYWYY